jgi:hypothetical protein
LIDEAVARAVETSHIPTRVNVGYFKVLFEALRGKAETAAGSAEAVVELSREHGLTLYVSLGTLLLSWARARMGDLGTGVTHDRLPREARTLAQEAAVVGPRFDAALLRTIASDPARVRGQLDLLLDAELIDEELGSGLEAQFRFTQSCYKTSSISTL